MEKSRLGISIGLLAAIVYLVALFGSFGLLLLAAFYILFCEQNVWLRQSAVKAVVLSLVFSLVSLVLGVIGSVVEGIFEVIARLGSWLIGFGPEAWDFGLPGLLSGLVGLVETVFFLILAFYALKGRSIAVGPLDRMIEKHLN